jgi:hypothetical protein
MTYKIELIQGVPYLVDKENRVYYYNPEKPEANIQIGTLCDSAEGAGGAGSEVANTGICYVKLFDDWKERLDHSIGEWRANIVEYERGKIPTAKKPEKPPATKSRKTKSKTTENDR